MGKDIVSTEINLENEAPKITIPSTDQYIIDNFIQKQNASFDRLKPSNTDILERPEADAPKADSQGVEVKKSADIW